MGPPEAPLPPHVPPPPAPPAGLTLARWLYVDERRTHEVHAGVRGREFVVRESAFANDDPEEVHDAATPFTEAWEAQLYHMELENRLGLLGSYWRRDNLAGPTWTRVRPQAFQSLELQPARADFLDGRVRFFHHHKGGAPDALVVDIPQSTPRGTRHLLARLAYGFPDADDGDLQVLHARLPPGPARSVLAREQLALQARGYAPLVLPADFERAHGADWRRGLRHGYDATLRRLSEGRLGVGKAEDERESHLDGVYTDYAASLADPRLIALHARFLDPGEEQRLIERGEVAIRKAIAAKRPAIPAGDQHLLTLLQASLLAREGLRAGGRASVDPEVAALVRRFAYYL